MEKQNERFFSVELKTKASLKNITLNSCVKDCENVLVEGTIGQLQHAIFTEGVVLEVFGDKGILRINLTPDEIKQAVKKRVGGHKE
jgi:hypothetical protein